MPMCPLTFLHLIHMCLCAPYVPPMHPLTILHLIPMHYVLHAMCLCTMHLCAPYAPPDLFALDPYATTCPLHAPWPFCTWSLHSYVPMHPLHTPWPFLHWPLCAYMPPMCPLTFLHLIHMCLRTPYVPPTCPLTFCTWSLSLRAMRLCAPWPFCTWSLSLRAKCLRAPYAPPGLFALDPYPYAPTCPLIFLHLIPIPTRLRPTCHVPMRLRALDSYPYVLRAYTPPMCPLTFLHLIPIPTHLRTPYAPPDLFALDPYPYALRVMHLRVTCYVPTRLRAPAMQVPASILIG